MENSEDQFCTLHGIRIDQMWGLCAGSFFYEGCNVLLNDGQPCALGKHARRRRKQNPESPMGPHSQGQTGHVCCSVGTGTFMYCFAIKVGDMVIVVNEDCGLKLMGVFGADFKASWDKSLEGVEEICRVVQSKWWTVTYVTKSDRDNELRHQAVGIVQALGCMKVEATEVIAVLNNPDEETSRQRLSRVVSDISRDILKSLKSWSIDN